MKEITVTDFDDDLLINAMFSPDIMLAKAAKKVFDQKHATDRQPPEPPHCSECFEGCHKCCPVGSGVKQ